MADAQQAHEFPALTSASLLSMGQLCNGNCTAIFTKNDPQKQMILTLLQTMNHKEPMTIKKFDELNGKSYLTGLFPITSSCGNECNSCGL